MPVTTTPKPPATTTPPTPTATTVSPLRSRQLIVRAVVLLVLLTVGILAASKLPIGQYVEDLRALRDTLAGVAWLPVVYIIGMGIANMLAVPVLPLAITAGVIWGWWGFPISMGGDLLGGMLGYGAARLGFRGAVAQILGEDRARRMGEFTSRNGFLGVFLLEVVYVPLPIVAYTAGSVGVPFRRFILGVAAGSTPCVAVYTLCGDTITQHAITVGDVARVAGVTAAYVGLILIVRRLVPQASGSVSTASPRSGERIAS